MRIALERRKIEKFTPFSATCVCLCETSDAWRKLGVGISARGKKEDLTKPRILALARGSKVEQVPSQRFGFQKGLSLAERARLVLTNLDPTTQARRCCSALSLSPLGSRCAAATESRTLPTSNESKNRKPVACNPTIAPTGGLDTGRQEWTYCNARYSLWSHLRVLQEVVLPPARAAPPLDNPPRRPRQEQA